MHKRERKSRIGNAGRLLIAGVACISGLTSASGEDTIASGPNVQCDIEVGEDQQTLRIQGVVLTENTLQGVYELEVRTLSGSGSSSIRQSGQFSASPGRPEYLGLVQFGGTAASYNAKLTLHFDEGESVCDKRIDQGKAG